MSNYLIWYLFGPSTWPIWALLVGLALLSRWPRWAHRVLIAGTAWTVLAAFTPLGMLLILPLEQRYPPVSDAMLGIPSDIVVLAGSERMAAARHAGRPEFSEAAERVIDGAALARRLPAARLTVVGGIHEPGRSLTDVDLTCAAWRALGLAPGRMRCVSGTTDTATNATALRATTPRHILLVTSAFHMPRAVASFRAAGFAPVPFPVDYQTPPPLALRDYWMASPIGNLARTDLALHEWVGLLYYRITGRTRELLPKASSS